MGATALAQPAPNQPGDQQQNQQPAQQAAANGDAQAAGDGAKQPDAISDINTPINIEGVSQKTIGELLVAMRPPNSYSDEFLGDRQQEMSEDVMYSSLSKSLQQAGVSQEQYKKTLLQVIESTSNEDKAHEKSLQEAIGVQSAEEVGKFINQVNAQYGGGQSPFNAGTMTSDQAKAFKAHMESNGTAANSNAQPPNNEQTTGTISPDYSMTLDGKQYGVQTPLTIASVGAFKAIEVVNERGAKARLIDMNSEAREIANRATRDLQDQIQANQPKAKRIDITLPQPAS